MTSLRKFNCPMTEAPCSEGGCTVDRCLRRSRAEAAQRAIEAENERRRWEAGQLTPEDLDIL